MRDNRLRLALSAIRVPVVGALVAGAVMGTMALGVGTLPAQENQARIAGTTTVYLLRHAEKRLDQDDDPDLSRDGRAHARRLAQILGNEPIDRIYSSEYRRTHFTVLPLAVKLRLPIVTIEASDGPRLVKRLLNEHQGETIVVCGHSDTVPEMIAGLGVSERVEIPDERYGDLFVVKITGGRANLERRSF